MQKTTVLVNIQHTNNSTVTRKYNTWRGYLENKNLKNISRKMRGTSGLNPTVLCQRRAGSRLFWHWPSASTSIVIQAQGTDVGLGWPPDHPTTALWAPSPEGGGQSTKEKQQLWFSSMGAKDPYCPEIETWQLVAAESRRVTNFSGADLRGPSTERALARKAHALESWTLEVFLQSSIEC